MGSSHVLMSKYRLSVNDQVLDKVRYALNPEVMKNGDLGYIDTISFHDSFTLAWHVGHIIPSLSLFNRFLLTLKSGEAVDENGRRLGKESEKILSSIFQRPPKGFIMQGERFNDTFEISENMLYLISQQPSQSGPVRSKREPLEKCLLEEDGVFDIDISSCTPQGLPTKKGTDCFYMPPDRITPNGKKISGFFVNEKGNAALYTCIFGSLGISKGLGVRLAKFVEEPYFPPKYMEN